MHIDLQTRGWSGVGVALDIAFWHGIREVVCDYRNKKSVALDKPFGMAFPRRFCVFKNKSFLKCIHCPHSLSALDLIKIHPKFIPKFRCHMDLSQGFTGTDLHSTEQRLVFFVFLFMVAFTNQIYCLTKGFIPPHHRLQQMVDGARPRSLPAGSYGPPCHPRYIVKRSIYTPTTTQIIWYHWHPNLVLLCSDHLCACRKKYPIAIYAYQLKISASESSKWESGHHFVLFWHRPWETCGLWNGTGGIFMRGGGGPNPRSQLIFLPIPSPS